MTWHDDVAWWRGMMTWQSLSPARGPLEGGLSPARGPLRGLEPRSRTAWGGLSPAWGGLGGLTSCRGYSEGLEGLTVIRISLRGVVEWMASEKSGPAEGVGVRGQSPHVEDIFNIHMHIYIDCEFVRSVEYWLWIWILSLQLNIHIHMHIYPGFGISD